MSLVAMESARPNKNRPGNFDVFWSATLDALREVEARPQLQLEKPPSANLSLHRLKFSSLGHVPVAGYLLTQECAEPRPLIVHSHGYNSQYDVMLNWANTGCHVLGVDTRGFGRSAGLALDSGGYVLTGIESPQTSILRGAVSDIVQAVAVGRAILGWQMKSLTLQGFSFGGAMALMAATLDTRPDLLVLGQPTFGWHEERLRLAQAGSAAEMRDRIRAMPQHQASILQTLDYFESMYFASRVAVPTFFGVGLDDTVVPPKSVMAIANELTTAPRELRYLPVAHSEDPRESLWSDFDDEWLGFTNTGLPSNFGEGNRAIRTMERK